MIDIIRLLHQLNALLIELNFRLLSAWKQIYISLTGTHVGSARSKKQQIDERYSVEKNLSFLHLPATTFLG